MVELTPGIDDWVPETLQKLGHMRQTATGQCSALKTEDGSCSCSIYQVRPNVCRTFQRGNTKCLESIEFKRWMETH